VRACEIAFLQEENHHQGRVTNLDLHQGILSFGVSESLRMLTPAHTISA
jgi:hypothetical protein